MNFGTGIVAYSIKSAAFQVLILFDPQPLFKYNTTFCIMQYDRLFNTTRIPGEEGDTLLTQADSTHIVVLYRVV